MWFSLFLLLFYTIIVGGTVLIVTKLIKKWSDKHVIVSKDDLYSFGLEKPKSIEKKKQQILNRDRICC